MSGPRKTVRAIRARIAGLRDECSAYDVETDRLKTDCIRAGGSPADRNAIDAARRGGFDALRSRLADAEAHFATWRATPNKPRTFAGSFGEQVAGLLRGPTPDAPPTSTPEIQ